jgi:hypothetical protein
MKELGLKRVAKELTLEDYIAENYGNRESTDNEDEPTGADSDGAKLSAPMNAKNAIKDPVND